MRRGVWRTVHLTSGEIPKKANLALYAKPRPEKVHNLGDHQDRNQNQSRISFEQAPTSDMLGIVFWRGDGTIEDANDAFLKIVGYTRADLQAGLLNKSVITPKEYADLDSLKSGIERQVKEHPGRTLLIAAGLGYLLGKAVRK